MGLSRDNGRQAAGQGLHPVDGHGLFLLVKENGSKTWRMKFKRPDGREGLATFGNYPALTLKAAPAPARRAEALELLAHGKDPIESARQGRVEVANARANTFGVLAKDWHDACSKKWSPGQSELDSLNSKVLQAARFYWADRFEKAAQELAVLAAHVSASEKLLGYGDSLTEFYIPTMSPEKSHFISHRRILDRRSDVKFEQLTDI